MTNNVVITGANRGIGLALCRAFRNKGYYVIALCRQRSPELAELNVNIVEGVDVVSEQGLACMHEALINTAIDILICNAGILRDESLSGLNLSSIREQFEVNALAPLRVVNSLQSNLKPGSKVAMITSRMGSIADNSSGGRYGYRMSKAALNAAAMSLSKDLGTSGVSVGIYHPGYVQTDMVNHRGDISADLSAERIANLIERLALADSGCFKHSNGQDLPW